MLGLSMAGSTVVLGLAVGGCTVVLGLPVGGGEVSATVGGPVVGGIVTGVEWGTSVLDEAAVGNSEVAASTVVVCRLEHVLHDRGHCSRT